MSDDPHILEAAQRMIDRYGDQVLVQIDERIEELGHTENENNETCDMWCQVRETVVSLLEAPSGNTVQ